jgi:glycosyltransferase involved in cell wall biosynthesis
LLPVFFASLQGKPSILVAGGYDTANIPEAHYGNQRHWFKRMITKYILRRSTHIICNSQYAKLETVRVAGLNPEKVTMIYHGVPDQGLRIQPKRDIALNVGNVLKENLLRKGITPFLEAGKLLPSYRFVQAGKWQDDSYKNMLKHLSPNVELKGFMEAEDLQALFSESRVYIQPSLHEAFGLSVVEAMQAGCIPIVSRNGALPEVVGKYGILLEDLTPHAIVKGIGQLDNYRFTPLEIREYVLGNYDLGRRKRKLIHCVREQYSQQHNR